jgi:hypothetical protein
MLFYVDVLLEFVFGIAVCGVLFVYVENFIKKIKFSSV